MPKFIVQTFYNVGPGSLWRFEASDRLIKGPEVTVEAASEKDALDVAWEAGNIGVQWGRNRSLSVGDVLMVGETAWAIAPLGFDLLDAVSLVAPEGGAVTRPDYPQDYLDRLIASCSLAFEYNGETGL